MKALLLENVHPVAEEILTSRGFEVSTMSGSLTQDELIGALGDVDLLGIRSNTKITPAVIEAAGSKLSAIGAFCIGTNQIDLAAASAAGVGVFNAPYSNTRSVVELALAEIIMLARRVTVRNSLMHKGVWDKSAKGSHEVRGRTLGIVGYGSIGTQLSVLAESLGMRVVFFDINDRLALGNARRMESLEELLAEADAVSLHVDGRPGNAGLFGEPEFAAMKPRSIFLNLSRGMLVDYESLRSHLESGHLAGAAVDVFAVEPKASGDPFSSPLQGMDNVILTPHVGGSTQEAQMDIGRFVAGKLADYAEFGATTMSVNLPAVAASELTSCRVVHLHHNVPGVLARLNSALANHQMNIGAQNLATKDDLGYVVTDVTGSGIEGLLSELAGLDETIRVRVL